MYRATKCDCISMPVCILICMGLMYCVQWCTTCTSHHEALESAMRLVALLCWGRLSQQHCAPVPARHSAIRSLHDLLLDVEMRPNSDIGLLCGLQPLSCAASSARSRSKTGGSTVRKARSSDWSSTSMSKTRSIRPACSMLSSSISLCGHGPHPLHL